MIDLHTHSLLSDGELLPSELARRAYIKGYTTIAITDHVDSSNIDFVVPRIVKVAKELNKHWKIKVLPGVEITHAPIEELKRLVKFARSGGAKIVIGHGETPSEPVIKGTNRASILAGVDILAHPGIILEEDVKLAKKKGVYLEISAKPVHATTNKHVAKMAKLYGAKLVINTDAHKPSDLITIFKASSILKKCSLTEAEVKEVYNNSKELVKDKCRVRNLKKLKFT